MANNSIFSAFERMWQHIVSTFATKEELNNINFPVDIDGGTW